MLHEDGGPSAESPSPRRVIPTCEKDLQGLIEGDIVLVNPNLATSKPHYCVYEGIIDGRHAFMKEVAPGGIIASYRTEISHFDEKTGVVLNSAPRARKVKQYCSIDPGYQHRVDLLKRAKMWRG